MRILIVVFLLSFNLLFSQNIYDPKWSDITVPHSGKVLSDFGDSTVWYEPIYVNGIIHRYDVHSKSVDWIIVPSAEQIYCYQKIPFTRHVVTIRYNDNILANLNFEESTLNIDGFKIFCNSNLKIAFHSDGTLWSYVKTPGKRVTFQNRIPSGEVGYEKGGLDLEPDNGGKPDKLDAADYLLSRNWLVIADDQNYNDNPKKTGGFGVYLRPTRAYFGTNELPRDYYAIMDSLDEDEVRIKSDFGFIKSQISFIVSVFPNKEFDKELLKVRIQNIQTPEPRIDPDVRLPNTNELRGWIDTNWNPFTNSPINDGFKYCDVFDPNNNAKLPVNCIVLFEEIWQKIDAWGTTYYHAKYPYTPVISANMSKANLISFINLMQNSSYQFNNVKLILYISALADYISTPEDGPIYSDTDEDEYCTIVENEIRRLMDHYNGGMLGQKIDGFYIDTLPLDGQPDKLEPMILSYRIMRLINVLFSYYDNNKKFIILHSSENPIGPARLQTGEIPWNQVRTGTYEQYELFAPFIDRYADVVLKGESYPIKIETENFAVFTAVKNYVADHIKYVVSQQGTSNSAGMLDWTRSAAPFLHDDGVRFFAVDIPLSIGNGSGNSRNQNWYTFTNSFTENSDRYTQAMKVNYLMVMNTLLDNYYSKGLLIYRNKNEFEIDNTHWKLYELTVAGPGVGNQDPYRNFADWDGIGFGPQSDYFRPAPVFWSAALQFCNYGTVSFNKQEIIENKDISFISNDYHLDGSYPNPFNASTIIKFTLPQTSQVTLKIFNTLGEEVVTIVSDRLSAGIYTYNWDASSFASGVYLYRLQAGNYVQTKKMILLK
jgi:hypothetical protein